MLCRWTALAIGHRQAFIQVVTKVVAHRQIRRAGKRSIQDRHDTYPFCRRPGDCHEQVLLAVATFALVVAAVPSRAQQTTTKDQLIGSWKVLSLKATTGDRVSYPLGAQVAGYVTITPTRFWLLFVDATRKAPARLMKAALRGLLSASVKCSASPT